jgi:hypothetical protein
MSSSTDDFSTTVVPLERFRKARDDKAAQRQADGLIAGPPVPQPLSKFPGSGKAHPSRAEDARNVKHLIAQLRNLSLGLANEPELSGKMKTLLDAAEELTRKLEHNRDFWDSLEDLAGALACLRLSRLEEAEHLQRIDRVVNGAASAILDQFGGKR